MNAVEVSLKEFKQSTFKPKKYYAEKALNKIHSMLKAQADKHGNFSLVDELIETGRKEEKRE